MKKRKVDALLGRLLVKIAPQIGATVVLEPEWNVVGQIIFKNGKKSYFRYNTLDLNPMGASEIARDKDYANFFMDKLGYPIIPKSKTFYSDRWAGAIGALDRKIDNAYKYAEEIGFPAIVKPNSGSQGVGVALVCNKTEFYSAMKVIFKADRIAIVQKPVYGKDYRVVVLDDKIISAYERSPLNITGDGKSTIEELIEKRQKEFITSGRDTRIKVEDPRIETKLKHQNLKMDHVPETGQKIFLLDNANLSSGGDSIDVTEKLHPKFRELAIKLTKDMGLRLCGVDFMIEGDISEKPDKYWVIEINSAPGLDHYAKIGKAQEQVVEDLYLEVLRHLEER
jgi:D-alanine-D-alanine ligase-like ATP-grasp enzyme